MGLLKTFAEVKASRVQEIAGKCPSSDDFKSMVNEATEILMQRGDWPGTIVPMRLLVRNGCVVWPRQVEQVRKINSCKMPLKVGNIWWDFVGHRDYGCWSANHYYSCSDGMCGTAGHHHHHSFGVLSGQGRVPTYNDVPLTNNTQYIRAYCLDPLDIGKTITIYGIDGNGQPLVHNNPTTGNMEDGLIITLAIPYGSTSTYVQRIDAVTKDITRGRVPLYAYDATSNTLLDLAVYDGSETTPSYAKDRLVSCHCGTTDHTIIALVKLAFIPVVTDSDWVLIPSMNALKKAVQSIRYGESGDIANQEAFMQAAVNELNRVLDNQEPLVETPVDSGFMGDEACIGMQKCI